MKQDAQVLMMLASVKVEIEASIVDLLVVCEFVNIFHDDFDDLPHECEF